MNGEWKARLGTQGAGARRDNRFGQLVLAAIVLAGWIRALLLFGLRKDGALAVEASGAHRPIVKVRR